MYGAAALITTTSSRSLGVRACGRRPGIGGSRRLRPRSRANRSYKGWSRGVADKPGGGEQVAAARAGAEIRGEVLLTLARLRLATPHHLRRLLLPHQEGTD